MNKGKKYLPPIVYSFIIISIIVPISAEPSYVFGITNYSPYWMDYEKEIGAPYFKYCGVFDSCFRNEIRIFPFSPLTSSQQDIEFDEDTSSKNMVSSILPQKKPETSMIPFELPFP